LLKIDAAFALEGRFHKSQRRNVHFGLGLEQLPADFGHFVRCNLSWLETWGKRLDCDYKQDLAEGSSVCQNCVDSGRSGTSVVDVEKVGGEGFRMDRVVAGEVVFAHPTYVVVCMHLRGSPPTLWISAAPKLYKNEMEPGE